MKRLRIIHAILALGIIGLMGEAGLCVTVNSFRAIENQGLWPNLTQLGDGTILASIFNKPSHLTVPGEIDTYASTDNGLTWQLRGTPALAEGVTARANIASGLAANGDVVLLMSGWGDPGTFTNILDPWITRSTDDGATWSVDKVSFPNPSVGNGNNFVPYGDVIQAPSGSLRVLAYSQNISYMLESLNDGVTWQEKSIVASGINETAPLSLGGNNWIAAGRTFGANPALNLYRSADDGVSWQLQEQVTSGLEHPGDLLKLQDGRILLTYGNRDGVASGIDAIISNDDGLTWGSPIRIKDLSGGGDVGYPSTVQRADGTLVTAWYSNEGGYHMGVGIWDAPGDMTLIVDPFTGAAVIKNQADGDISLVQYTVESASGSLLNDPSQTIAVGWDSLDETGVDGNVWLRGAGSNELLVEVNPASSTLISTGSTFDIGLPFSTGGQQDLVFKYLIDGGTKLVTGIVEYSSLTSGDFDSDGDVDGADFLMWQQGFGTTFNATDLDDWEANYGSSPAPVSAGVATSVPEPASGLLLALGVFVLISKHSRGFVFV